MLAQSLDLTELVNAPLGDGLTAKQDELGKGTGPHTSADRKASNLIGDVKYPAIVMNVWWHFEKYRRVQVPTRHSNPSPPKYAERVDDGQDAPESNIQFSNLICFRPTAFAVRSTVPDAANDNFAPSEAA